MINIDTGRRTVNGVRLTPTQWAIVQVLAKANGEPVREDDIARLTHLAECRWHIKNIRDLGVPVENIRGHGYRLDMGNEGNTKAGI